MSIPDIPLAVVGLGIVWMLAHAINLMTAADDSVPDAATGDDYPGSDHEEA